MAPNPFSRAPKGSTFSLTDGAKCHQSGNGLTVMVLKWREPRFAIPASQSRAAVSGAVLPRDLFQHLLEPLDAIERIVGAVRPPREAETGRIRVY